MAAALVGLNYLFHLAVSRSLSASLVAFSGIRISGLRQATLTSIIDLQLRMCWILQQTAPEQRRGLCKVGKQSIASTYRNRATEFVSCGIRKFHPHDVHDFPSAIHCGQQASLWGGICTGAHAGPD